MKKTLVLICATMLLLLGSGCEKIIDFNGEETEPRLTISAQAEVGEPLEAYVASSVFFLTSANAGKAYTAGLDTLRGQVRCFVNGSQTAHVLTLEPAGEYATSLHYCAHDYAPAPGDRIRLEAEFPGFDAVWAETTVPLNPAFEIVSAKWRKVEKEWFDDYELELTLAVTDDASYEKYYFVQPVVQFQDPYSGEEEMWRSYRFTSNDVLFREMNGNNAMEMLDEDEVGNYFSDVLIKGQRREFTITVSSLPEKEETTHYWVHCAAVGESLYWFDYSYSQLSGGFGLFSEGVTLYSNVHGGYGVFGAAASKWLEVDW